MKKMALYQLFFLVALVFFFPVPTHAASLCEQFPTTEEQQRCASIYSYCSATPGNVECEKAAAASLITLLAEENCTAGGMPVSQCTKQLSAARDAVAGCFNTSTDTVASCRTKVEAAIINLVEQQKVAAEDAALATQEAKARAVANASQNQNTQNTNTQNPTRTNNNNGNLGYTPLEPLPGLADAQSGNTNFARLLQSGFSVLISIGALSAVVMLIFGGITYMVSDVVHKKTGALHRIQAALWGLLLLVASWLILNTINPSLTNFALILNPTPPPSASGLNTVTSGTVGNFTIADSDPNRDSKLRNWCPGGLTDPVSSQLDEFGTQFSTYVCSPPDSR